MNKLCRILCCFLLSMAFAKCFCLAETQSKPNPGTQAADERAQPPQKVPVMDGGIGPCSLELTVTTVDGKPVYAAIVKVHITYGFAGIRRLDLEAGTNSDGKLKFTGLPSRVHRPPLEFDASKDQLAGKATYDPGSECHAKHDIVLEAPKPESNKQ